MEHGNVLKVQWDMHRTVKPIIMIRNGKNYMWFLKLFNWKISYYKFTKSGLKIKKLN